MIPAADQRTFQLSLLGAMRASRRVTDALASLGAVAEAIPAAKERLRSLGFDRPGHPAALYRDALGAPHTVEDDDLPPSSPFAGSRSLRFRLPLWPAHDFRVHEHPTGYAWGWGFAEPRGAATGPRAASELTPWSFTKERIDAAFGPGEVEEAWDTFADVRYLIPPAPGAAPAAYLVTFDFDLLQTVQPL